MIVRPTQLRHIPSFLLPLAHPVTPTIWTRFLHQRIATPPIPSPTPFVPDTKTFLTLIGRNLSQHASKIPSWEALFSLTSTQLKELGVEPPRSRRYLLRWRDKFRNGQFGIYGDAKSVVDGTAEFRIIEVPRNIKDPTKFPLATATTSPGMRKVIVNVPVGAKLEDLPEDQITRIEGLKIKGADTIAGSHVQPVKGLKGVAKIVIKEGLWEDRRGHKIDGGERRQAEVRAKKRSEEKKQAA